MRKHRVRLELVIDLEAKDRNAAYREAERLYLAETKTPSAFTLSGSDVGTFPEPRPILGRELTVTLPTPVIPPNYTMGPFEITCAGSDMAIETLAAFRSSADAERAKRWLESLEWPEIDRLDMPKAHEKTRKHLFDCMCQAIAANILRSHDNGWSCTYGEQPVRSMTVKARVSE